MGWFIVFVVRVLLCCVRGWVVVVWTLHEGARLLCACEDMRDMDAGLKARKLAGVWREEGAPGGRVYRLHFVKYANGEDGRVEKWTRTPYVLAYCDAAARSGVG
jgi:hypothetical protein